MADYITCSELARRRGVSKMAVSKAIKESRLRDCVHFNDNGLAEIDWSIAVIECDKIGFGESNPKPKENVEKTVKTIIPKVETKNIPLDDIKKNSSDILNEYTDYAEATRLEKIYKAQRAKLEVDEIEGRLVNKEEVYKKLYSFGSELKNNLLSIPDRITDELISLSDDRNEFYSLLSKEIENVLTVMSSYD